MSATTNESNNCHYNVGQSDIGEGLALAQSDLPPPESSWRSLLEISSNKSRKTRGSNYVQLATVCLQTHQPRVRCVVFRGFLALSDHHALSNRCDNLSCLMKMVTDQRSQKVDQVRENKTAELVWWFPKSSEQYRIRGDLVFVGGGSFEYDNDPELVLARKQQWGNLSEAARESFLDPVVPGAPYSGATTASVPRGGRDADGTILPPPDTFLLMLLVPRHCDYLRLQHMYRQIDSQSLETKEWTSVRVNP